MFLWKQSGDLPLKNPGKQGGLWRIIIWDIPNNIILSQERAAGAKNWSILEGFPLEDTSKVPNIFRLRRAKKSDPKVYDPQKVYDPRKFSKSEGGCYPERICELDHPYVWFWLFHPDFGSRISVESLEYTPTNSRRYKTRSVIV